MAVSEELKRVTSSRLNWLPGVRYADIIEFVGRVKGLKTYNAILGNSITVPEISIIQAQLIAKPESTEGRPWGQSLKKPSGAPLNLG